MISECVHQSLVLLVREKGAFVSLGSAGLLEFRTTLVDCCEGGEFVDFGVDAEIFAGSEGQVF